MEEEFLQKAYAAAKAAEHVWPDYAACEAAIESDWGANELAVKANNLFNARWMPGAKIALYRVKAVDYASFASWQACFAARAKRMRAMTMFYRALRAGTGVEYLAAMTKLTFDLKRSTAVAEMRTKYAAVFA